MFQTWPSLEKKLQEINTRSSFFNLTTNHSTKLKNHILNYLENDANAQSHHMEVESESFLSKGEKDKILDNLTKAWNFATKQYKKKAAFSNDFFLDTVVKLFAQNPTCAHYRTEPMYITNSQAVPVSPDKIHHSMENTWHNFPQYSHPAVQAAYLHFNITTVHPLLDGNGRMARLSQNLVLNADQLPPIIMTPEDKPEYIHLLEKSQVAHASRRENFWDPLPNSQDERNFYEYIADKLINSLELLKGYYTKGNVFTLIFDPGDKALGHTIKNSIQSLTNSRKLQCGIDYVPKSDAHKMMIYGDISKSCVQHVLDHNKSISNYTLHKHQLTKN